MEIDVTVFIHERINMMHDLKVNHPDTFRSFKKNKKGILNIKAIYIQLRAIRTKTINTRLVINY